MVACTKLRFVFTALTTLLGSRVGDSRTFNGTYTILNKANGRRLSSNTQGFSATPRNDIHAFHRWRLIALEEGAYAIVNAVNAMRVFAQAGKDGNDGFLTIDNGPIYQDQRWNLVLQPDGSYALVNVRSGRRIMARAGFEGAAGFIAAVSDGPVIAEQAWWLLDPDIDEAGPLLLEITKMRAQIDTLIGADNSTTLGTCTKQASIKEQMEDEPTISEFSNQKHLQNQIAELEVALRICRANYTHHSLLSECRESFRTRNPCSIPKPKDHTVHGHASLKGKSMLQQEFDDAIFTFNCEQTFGVFGRAVIAFFTLCTCTGIVRHAVRFFKLRHGEAGAMKNTLADDTVFGDAFQYHVFPCKMPGEQEISRLVKIQCPGVEHGDVDITLLWNGCDVAISRRASLGIQPSVWKKRIELDPADGPYEFREDYMTLENGFLQLAFRVGAFQTRAVRFPQHFSLSSTDSDLCWECPVPGAGDYGTCAEDVTDSTVCVHEMSPRPGYSAVGGA